MRFLIEVDGAWKVTIHCKEAPRQWQRIMMQVDDGDDGKLPAVDRATQPASDVLVSTLHGRNATEIMALYNRIVDREMQPGEVRSYGAYLFDCLIGSTAWGEIKAVASASRAETIELALCWDKNDTNLSRLHWETMYDGERFLTSGLAEAAMKTDVAITRIVPTAAATAKCLGPIPKVLFVIGQPLTDSTIRPGAEIMSLLQNSSLEHRINAAILESASPTGIERKVKSFKPEIVHFICHGMIDPVTNEGKLILQPDHGNPNKHFGAQQVVQWLAPALPVMVVLSACETAIPTGAASGAALGPQAVSPLASQLVAHGIPIVIGMSGRVSDLACRLFTRCFGEALISGDTLVAASAKGRRAAFAHSKAPPDNPDWAFPTVYMSGKVATDYAPACGNDELKMSDRLQEYALPHKPVFCGRQDFLEAYRDLIEDKSFNVLAAIAPDKTRGFGRTRLLQQLTRRAVFDGHVPCPVLSNSTGWSIPKGPLDLAVLIDKASKVARRSLGLSTGEDTPVMVLQMYKNGHMSLQELPQLIKQALRRSTGVDREVTPEAVQVALELQFKELMDEARNERPAAVNQASRAIVLLDDADDYLHLLLSIADEAKLGASGLGGSERVPVIMATSAGTPARDVLQPNSPRPGWKPMELRPFNKSADRREDMLAYARVLMNPFDENILKDVSGKAWFLDYGAPTDAIKDLETKYSSWLRGLPIEFGDKPFYMIAQMARDGFVVEADDEKALRALVGEAQP